MSHRFSIRNLSLSLGSAAMVVTSIALTTALSACGSWQPVATPGKCHQNPNVGREWVPAEVDPEGENSKEGYCKYKEGYPPTN